MVIFVRPLLALNTTYHVVAFGTFHACHWTGLPVNVYRWVLEVNIPRGRLATLLGVSRSDSPVTQIISTFTYKLVGIMTNIPYLVPITQTLLA